MFDDEFHGQNGPLNVSKIRHENKPTKDFVETASKIHGYNKDFNGSDQEGIGFYQTTSARSICNKAGITQERRINDLTEDELSKLRDIIDADYLVEGDLRRKTSMDVKRYLDLGCLRGLRHRRNLPVRGQRTHTNARTRKGPAKAIAGKKK